MYMDQNLVMSDAQAVTATAVSTKSIDTMTTLRNLGTGTKVELIVTITTAVAASGGASTTVFTLQDSADNTTFADVVASPAIGKATLVAGYEALRIHLPATLQRYIAMNYTVATNNWTAGAVTAYLAIDRQDNVTRPSGFTV